MTKTTRINRIIASLSRLQAEEGVNDAGLGLAKSALSKVRTRWQERDGITRQAAATRERALAGGAR